MSDAIESQGTKLELAGAAGGAKTITDMTLSNPTILTSVAHGLSNGDVVTLADFAGVDAGDLNGEVVSITNVTTDTFAVQIDTTGKTITDNTDTATATPKTWTEIGEITDLNLDDPGASEIDVTHLGSTAKEFLPGLSGGETYTFSLNYLFGDAGQEALRAAKLARQSKTFRATYPDATTASFSGHVQVFNGPGAAVDGKLEGNCTIKVSGGITYA